MSCRPLPLLYSLPHNRVPSRNIASLFLPSPSSSSSAGSHQPPAGPSSCLPSSPGRDAPQQCHPAAWRTSKTVPKYVTVSTNLNSLSLSHSFSPSLPISLPPFLPSLPYPLPPSTDAPPPAYQNVASGDEDPNHLESLDNPLAPSQSSGSEFEVGRCVEG